MKITREQTWDMGFQKWCPVCGKVVDMEPISTGMPGITASKYPECDGHYQYNYLESKDDLLEVPDDFILPEGE